MPVFAPWRFRALRAGLPALLLALLTLGLARIASAAPLPFTSVYDFSAQSDSGTNGDGASPRANLIVGTDGNFYGTASTGGVDGDGTVFKVTTTGTLTTLYTFTGGNDGSLPISALTLGSDNNFYGTTYAGGAHGEGTVFKITPAGALTTLYAFSALSKSANSDGAGPNGLVADSSGNFYGTASTGGANGDGTVFRITPGGTFTALHAFAGGDGANPSAALALGPGGNFYGTTYDGGTNGDGTVFEITPAGTLTTLASFNYSGNGAYPYAGLVLGPSNTFYGTTYGGGLNGEGTVFKITSGGTLTTLYAFSALTGDYPDYSNSDGANPYASLVLGTDGNFYGTTTDGGTNDDGTVFEITPAGTLATLYAFSALSASPPYSDSDGANPYAGLVLGTDGNFYGTTYNGGANGSGAIFSVPVYQPVPATVLVSPATATVGENGTQTFTATVEDGNGNVFTPSSLTWSVSGGGTINASTGVFTAGMTMGTYTVTATATANGGSQTGTATVTVGTPPIVTITPGTQTATTAPLSATATSSDGNALTYAWSVSPSGVFSSATTGTATSGSPFNNTLTVGAAGTYTITVMATDDSHQMATATQSVTFVQVPTTVTVSPAAVSVAAGAMQTFTASVKDQFGAAISSPSVAWSVSGGGTIDATTGVFTAGTTAGTYTVTATATANGASQTGTASVTVTGSGPAITSFTPTSGPVGTSVVITGTNFTGATSVTFNGTTASFTVNSSTQITATVPSGATTGAIKVQTGAGAATSATNFTITAGSMSPTITSFSPSSGPVGTSVVITGTNFTSATFVTFNGTTATFTVNSSTQITATVPSGATTGVIKVRTSNGVTASAMSFTVTAGSLLPSITSFSPSSGPVGTSVVITGTNFTGATFVTFNGTSASFTVNSATQITANVPSGATTGVIKVRTSNGVATSATSFTVTAGSVLPSITSFSPTSGPIGTAVVITGTNFTGATFVTFNGTVASFTVNSSTQITATVPSGATTGVIKIRTPNGVTASATSFTVTS